GAEPGRCHQRDAESQRLPSTDLRLMADVIMPRLSDTMEEGTIATWLKKPGDQIAKGDVIAQIETDKATMDLTSFEAGTLQEIMAPEGSTVPIGKPVARIGSGAIPAAASPPPAEAARAGAGKPAAARENVAEALKPTSKSTSVGGPRADDPALSRSEPQRTPEADGKVRASPVARHIAAEHGLDLSQIQ